LEQPVATLAVDEAMVIPVLSKKKRNVMLPILVVLFLISYGLMSLLVVEQGRTIESQRGLIRDLFNDSTELSALKAKQILMGRVAPPATNKGKSQLAAPPAQVSPESHGKHKGAAHTERPALQKPPKPAMDAADARRMPLTA